MLRDVAHNQVERKQATYSYMELVAEMFLMHQERNQSNDDYYKLFQSHVETIKAHGGIPWGIESLSKKYLEELLEGKQLSELADDAQTAIKAKADEATVNEVLACLFICLADGKRYNKLRNWMANHFALGANKYLRDLTSALAVLKDFKGVHGGSGKISSRRDNNREAGLSFANPGDKPL